MSLQRFQVNSLKILLLQPRASAEPAYPLRLASMVPLFRQRGHRVVGADLHFQSVDSLLRLMRRENFDWIGASVLPHNAIETGLVLRRLKERPPMRTFITGAFAEIDPRSALEQTGADIAVLKDPESWAKNLGNSSVSIQELPGCAFLQGGKIVVNPPVNRMRLKELPIPDRTVFPPSRYGFAMRSTDTPYAAIYTSRGCHLRCPYCPVPAATPHGFDARSPEQVYEEMARLAHLHGVRSVHVEDDAFLADSKRAARLCELLLKKPLPVVWELVNGIRPSQAQSELFTLMGQAGCRRVVFSFEHIETGNVPDYGCSLPEAKKSVRTARHAGMRVGGYFIVGLPGVGMAETTRSIRLALSLGLDDANFSPFYLAMGSPYAARPNTLSTALPRPIAAGLAVVGQLAFFAYPRPLARLLADVFREPRTLPSLARKAWELLRHGGPVPVRDTP